MFPKKALATLVHLRWAEIPMTEQGEGLQTYEILYWVNGQQREINKTDVSIGRPSPIDGFILYEIQGLQTGLEYKVAVYGKNQYSTGTTDHGYFSTEITVTPSAGGT